MANVTYQRAATSEDLYNILHLQKLNLPQGLSQTEKQQEGFLTVSHSYELLKEMNEACPHFIVYIDEEFAGYALSMTRDFSKNIKVLIPMFNLIDKLVPDNKSYLVMGQICIAKKFRRTGLFKGLYQEMQKSLNHQFELMITEVDAKNTRSLNAHFSIGFTSIIRYHSNDQDWELIAWDWH